MKCGQNANCGPNAVSVRLMNPRLVSNAEVQAGLGSRRSGFVDKRAFFRSHKDLTVIRFGCLSKHWHGDGGRELAIFLSDNFFVTERK